MIGTYRFPPAPARLTPEPGLMVAAVFHERGKLCLSHRHPRDGKGADFHRMRPFFVIEDEGLIGPGSHLKGASRDLHITPQLSFREVHLSSSFVPSPCPLELRCWVTERLPRVGERLRVH